MGLTGNQIHKLGSRLRDAEPTGEDLALLDAFRYEYDEVLLICSHSLCLAIQNTGTAFLLAGRAKRTKSIIRKLRRPENKHMDLSRMDDIVGVRVIVADADAQNRVIKAISASHQEIRKPFDYREAAPGRYRAVHLILGEPARRLEVQVRTCAQHLWADYCERLGERAKEGNASEAHQPYLEDLGRYCIALDAGGSIDGSSPFGTPMKLLRSRFEQETAQLGANAGRSYVVVYDSSSNQLLRCEYFESTPEGRREAVSFYRYQANILSESQFDVLVLNSRSQDTLRVTHPRYFPE